MRVEKEIIGEAKRSIAVGVSRVCAGEVYGYVQIGHAEAMLDMLWKSMDDEEEAKDD